MHLVLISCITLNDQAWLQNLVLGEDYFLGRHYLHKIKGIYRGTHNWHYWRVTFKKLSTTQSRSHLLNSTLPSDPYHIVCSPKQKSAKILCLIPGSHRGHQLIHIKMWQVHHHPSSKQGFSPPDSNLQLTQNTAGTCFELLRDSKDYSLGCFRSIQLFLYLLQITGHREGLQTCYTSRHMLQVFANLLQWVPAKQWRERNPL